MHQVLTSQISFPGLLTTMFAAAGTLINVSKRAQNQGKVCLIFQVMTCTRELNIAMNLTSPFAMVLTRGTR